MMTRRFRFGGEFEVPLDACGLTADERLEEIRICFFNTLALTGRGNGRSDFYHRPAPGDARRPTELELAERWAERLDVPLAAIRAGIHAAFRTLRVSHFRDCVPFIQQEAERC